VTICFWLIEMGRPKIIQRGGLVALRWDPKPGQIGGGGQGVGGPQRGDDGPAPAPFPCGGSRLVRGLVYASG